MTPRGFFVFTAITAALIVGAVAIYPASPSSNPEPGARFFPNLGPEAVNQATALKITTKGKSFTIQRKGKEWVVADKGGYPAQFSKVKEALVSVASLQRFERKTEDKDLLHKLDLEDPAKAGTSSKRLTVLAGDKTIADVIIGKSNAKEILIGRALVYVRMPDSSQAWLAIGDPKLEATALGWIDKALFKVDTDRVRKIDQKLADGGTIVVEKAKPEDKEVTLVNKPEGREIKNARFLRYIAEGLADLKLEDVTPASKIDFAKNAAGTVVFRTFDGLVVTVKLATVGEKKDEKTWATIEASVDETALLKKKPAKDSALKTADAVKKEAEAINAKVEGWAYNLDSTVTRFMLYKMDELLKPEKKAEKKPDTPDKTAAEPKPAAPSPAAKTDDAPASTNQPDAPAKKGDTAPDTKAPDTKPADKPADKDAKPADPQ